VTLYSSQIAHSIEPSAICSKPNSIGSKAKQFDPQKYTHSSSKHSLKNKIVFIGVPDDRGVRVNGGKAGASEGPASFRKAFYALSDYTVSSVNSFTLADHIFDAGDLVLEKTVAETHENLAKMLKFFITHGAALVVVIGGGHDFSYGSYLGHSQASGGTIPILNFDAHFDLRPLSEVSATNKEPINSGTPFYRIVENLPQSIAAGKALLEIGIQRERNSQSLFDYAESKGIRVLEFDALSRKHFALPTRSSVSLLEYAKDFLDSCVDFGWHKYNQKLHCSIDLDVFSQSLAPGTSASTPFGVELSDVGELISYLSKTRLARVLDIAELCLREMLMMSRLDLQHP
jgi:formiminoglutamase